MERPTDLALLLTGTEPHLAETLEALARDAAIVRTISEQPRATVEPRSATHDSLGVKALAELGDADAPRGVVSGLALEQTIGEGGMGVIRLATQRTLGRRVAVKTLRPEGRTEKTTLRLLREAWVTGALEHPNIVPVHDLGLDEAGAPVIVLKRIEGETWDKLLADPARVAQFGSADVLEHHLRIFVQVCRAVSLAHARGILHRDLKPENVMIGRFGEVYVVDWGIAVSLIDDPTGRLPTLGASTEMAGTPCYMAPEMLGGRGLDERTDVYLLGAVLHEILTGAPPHQGSFHSIVASILRSTPRYDDDVPPDLAEIARRAMMRVRDERFTSVDELRARVEWFLARRGSIALSDAAQARLGQLRELAATGGRREAVQRAMAEASFGFRQALVASADNEAARRGLRETIVTGIGYELAQGALDRAEALLGELEDPPPELVEQVAAAMRERDEERARLARLEAAARALDPRVGGRTRLVGVSLAVMWALIPFVGPSLEAQFHTGTRASYLFTIGTLGLNGSLLFWARAEVAPSFVTRRAVASILLLGALQLTLEIGLRMLGLSREHGNVLHLFVWFATAATGAIYVNRKLLAAALGYLAVFMVALVAPERTWTLAGIGNFILLATTLFAWSSRRSESPPSSSTSS